MRRIDQISVRAGHAWPVSRVLDADKSPPTDARAKPIPQTMTGARRATQKSLGLWPSSGHGEIGESSATDGLVEPVKGVRLYGINKHRLWILLIRRRARKSEGELFSGPPEVQVDADAVGYQPHKKERLIHEAL